MSDAAKHLSDREFKFAFFADYQDGQLPGAESDRMSKLLEGDDGFKDKFIHCRGELQLLFRQISLSEDQRQELRRFVEDDVALAEHEASNIKELEVTERTGNTMRGLVLAALFFLIGWFGYQYLAPPSKPLFQALDNLVYEAIVMSEEDDRLDFPTNSLSEVRNYISRYPSLGFQPYMVKDFPVGWQLQGATVIDYDFIKIPAIQFHQTGQGSSTVLFQYPGRLSDLPSAPSGQLPGLKYQAYSDDQMNIVAWQLTDKVMGMLVGPLGAQDLAKIAQLQIQR